MQLDIILFEVEWIASCWVFYIIIIYKYLNFNFSVIILLLIYSLFGTLFYHIKRVI